MKIHIPIGTYAFIEKEVPDDISMEELLKIWDTLYEFPLKAKGKWKRPPEEADKLLDGRIKTLKKNEAENISKN